MQILRVIPTSTSSHPSPLIRDTSPVRRGTEGALAGDGVVFRASVVKKRTAPTTRQSRTTFPAAQKSQLCGQKNLCVLRASVVKKNLCALCELCVQCFFSQDINTPPQKHPSLPSLSSVAKNLCALCASVVHPPPPPLRIHTVSIRLPNYRSKPRQRQSIKGQGARHRPPAPVHQRSVQNDSRCR